MCERSESRFQSTQGTPESAKLHRVMTIGRTLNCRHVEITQRGLEGRSQVCPPSESAHSPGGSWPTQASFAHPASEYRTDGHDGYPPISRGRLFRIRSSDSRRARGRTSSGVLGGCHASNRPAEAIFDAAIEASPRDSFQPERTGDQDVAVRFP